MAKGDRGEIAFLLGSSRKARPWSRADLHAGVEQPGLVSERLKIIFLRGWSPLASLTMAARSASMMRSKFTFVGQFCMQDLQTTSEEHGNNFRIVNIKLPEDCFRNGYLPTRHACLCFVGEIDGADSHAVAALHAFRSIPP